jgi:hypothetical protein
MSRRNAVIALLAVPFLGVGLTPVAVATASATASVVSHAPMIRSVTPNIAGTTYSQNWSGYAAKGATFNSVSASWVQPTGKCTSKVTYSAFWVGLDGYSSQTVEQTGSEVDCVGGSPKYYAWYEMYPSFPVNFAEPVAPGDAFTASVTASGTSFTLTISDTTEGWSQTENKTLASAKKSSAEVIAEAPCCTAGGAPLPLTNFGTANFTDATVDGSPIGTFKPVRINMGTAAVPKDVTSPLSAQENFSEKWRSH